MTTDLAEVVRLAYRGGGLDALWADIGSKQISFCQRAKMDPLRKASAGLVCLIHLAPLTAVTAVIQMVDGRFRRESFKNIHLLPHCRNPFAASHQAFNWTTSPL